MADTSRRIKVDALNFDEIKKYSFSEKDFDKDGLIIFNPELIYSAMVKNGKVVSLMPISRRKK